MPSDVGIVNVKAAPYNATGDGTTDDTAAIQAAIDAAFGSAASPHGTDYYLNKQLYFPPGHYRADDLLLSKVQGGRILGAGRFVTTIQTLTAGVPAMRTNGFGYCHVEGIHFQASGSTPVFDLDYDGSGGGAALQSNTFLDCFYQGASFGVQIAASTFMGSENLFLNCFFISHSGAGLLISASNALQQTVIGGNFQACGKGIWVASGSCPIIHGVGFQQSADYDIRVDNSTNSNAMSIQGCRTESTNFYIGGVPVSIVACAHTSGTATNGDFAVLNGNHAHIQNCYSTHGRLVPKFWVQLRLAESTFDRADAFQPDGLWFVPNNATAANIEMESVFFENAHILRQRVTADPDEGPTNYLSFDYEVAAGVPH